MGVGRLDQLLQDDAVKESIAPDAILQVIVFFFFGGGAINISVESLELVVSFLEMQDYHFSFVQYLLCIVLLAKRWCIVGNVNILRSGAGCLLSICALRNFLRECCLGADHDFLLLVKLSSNRLKPVLKYSRVPL